MKYIYGGFNVKKINRLVAVIGLSLLAVVLASCGAVNQTSKVKSVSGEEKGKETVRIGYQKGNTLNILKESGFLEEALESEGYDVEWKEFSHGGYINRGSCYWKY